MNGSGNESDPERTEGGEFAAGFPGELADESTDEFRVQARLTRRPNARRRRFPLVTKTRLKNLTAPLDSPFAEFADLPGLGVFFLAIMAIIAIVVIGVLLGGFLVAFVELTLLGLLALAGSTWAWLRGHPKVAVIEIGDQRWLRADGPSVSLAEDAEAIARGTTAAALGYDPIT